jgi:hypothetical protein
MGSNPVKPISPYVAGNDCEPRDTQRLIKEDDDLLRLQMMKEEVTGDDIEAARGKRQGESVAGDSRELLARAIHVSERAVEDCGSKLHFIRELLRNIRDYVTGASSHVQ